MCPVTNEAYKRHTFLLFSTCGAADPHGLADFTFTSPDGELPPDGAYSEGLPAPTTKTLLLCDENAIGLDADAFYLFGLTNLDNLPTSAQPVQVAMTSAEECASVSGTWESRDGTCTLYLDNWSDNCKLFCSFY